MTVGEHTEKHKLAEGATGSHPDLTAYPRTRRSGPPRRPASARDFDAGTMLRQRKTIGRVRTRVEDCRRIAVVSPARDIAHHHQAPGLASEHLAMPTFGPSPRRRPPGSEVIAADDDPRRRR